MKLKSNQWDYLYQLLEEPMIDYDCGQLCAPNNHGIPVCCDENLARPVLFKGEMKWQNQKSDFWQKVTHIDTSELGDQEIYGHCEGCHKCQRNLRALVCRTYPFDPYLDADGALCGLTYNYDQVGLCPLINTDCQLRKPYIVNSLTFWDFVFQHDPDQYDLYMAVGEELREAIAQGQTVRLFTPDHPEGFALKI